MSGFFSCSCLGEAHSKPRFFRGPNCLLLVRKLGDKKGRAEAAQLVADVHFALASMGLGNPQARYGEGEGLLSVLVPFKERDFFHRNWFCGDFFWILNWQVYSGMEWNGRMVHFVMWFYHICLLLGSSGRDLRTLMTRDGNIQPNRAKSPVENGYQRSIGLTGISKLPMNVW